jgi:basic amino acid/polyamine antiporter, APA family
MTDDKQRPELVQWLGAGGALAIVAGTMIGTGIFLIPSGAAAAAGSPGLLYGAWAAAGVLSLLGTLVYSELSIAIPEPGGTYAYLSRGFGPAWGFLYGWTHSVLSGPAAEASLAAGMARFCLVLAPGLARFQTAGADAVAVLALLALTALNYFGLRAGGRVQVVLTAVKAISLAAIVCAGLFFFRGGGRPETAVFHAGTAAGTFSGFLTAVAAALWAYDGWAELAKAGSEIKNPGRNMHRALLCGVLLVGGLYLLFNAACLRVLSYQGVAASQQVASDVFARIAGNRAVLWVTLMMAVAALGSLNSSILTAARVPYAMARDGAFFRMASRIDPRRRTPGGALLFQCGMSSLFALTGTFEELTSLFVFSEWLFYGLAAAALIRLRYSEPELSRSYRCWGYPWVPGLVVLSAAALAGRIWMQRPLRCTAGLALISSGLFFRRYWLARSNNGFARHGWRPGGTWTSHAGLEACPAIELSPSTRRAEDWK